MSQRTRTITRYIIEHKSRGAFVGFKRHHLTGEFEPRFMWSVARSDPKVLRFLTEAKAKEELAVITRHVTNCHILPLYC